MGGLAGLWVVSSFKASKVNVGWEVSVNSYASNLENYHLKLKTLLTGRCQTSLLI